MSQLVFGKYEVLRRLAIGGMGEVFLARQSGIPGFERLAILKNLLPELASREGFVDQFLDEARVAATLNHPNLVQIFEVGLWNGTYFIAMEYIPGENLSGLARAAQAAGVGLPLPVVAKVIHDAALGLAHAHDALDVRGQRLNIVHRDVSPQNIMVRGDGVTKVVDFGIAKASNRQTRTQTGALKGKLAYMPAEQALGKELDGRADQYSLGVVLWELCTGKRLFRAESEIEILKKVLTQRIPRPSELVPGFPPELEAVVMRMVDRDVARRFPSLGEAATELRTYLESCSREASEKEVAAVVGRLVGEVLEERNRAGATPADNFVISFDRAGSTPRPTTKPGLRGGEPLTETGQPGAGGRPALRPTNAPTSAARPSGTRPSERATGFDARPDAGLQPQPAPVAAPGGKRRAPAILGAAGALLVAGVLGAWILRDAPPPEPASPPQQQVAATPGAAPTPAVMPPTPTPATTPRPALPPPPAAPPVLVLRSEPPGASVKLGAELLGTTPATIRTLAPGVEHRLTVELAGHRSEVVPVRLEAGSSREILLPLSRVSGRAPSRPAPVAVAAPVASGSGKGFLSLETKPWSRVSVDGEPAGSTPLYKQPLAAGRHTLRMVNEEAGVDVVRKIDVAADQTVKLNLSLK